MCREVFAIREMKQMNSLGTAPNYFFMPLTGREFWVQAGVARVIRALSPESELVLLLPDHPRVRGTVYEELSEVFFDARIDLPCPGFSLRSVPESVRDIADFKSKVKQICFGPNAVTFLCDMGHPIHFLFCRTAEPGRDGRRPFVVNLLTFKVEMKRLALGLNIRKTLSTNAYTLPMSRVFVRWYHLLSTKTPYCYTWSPKLHDLRVRIEHDLEDEDGFPTIQRVPYPVMSSLDSPIKNQALSVDDGAVILLVDGSLFAEGYIESEESYWDNVAQVARTLVSIFGAGRVYAKAHPETPKRCDPQLRGLGLRILDKMVPMEVLFLVQGAAISAVVGNGSTSLITASWSGIAAYDISGLVGVKPGVIDDLTDFFSQAPSIKTIESIVDMRTVLTRERAVATTDTTERSSAEERWADVLSHIGQARAGRGAP
jgi:hypothetical protein